MASFKKISAWVIKTVKLILYGEIIAVVSDSH